MSQEQLTRPLAVVLALSLTFVSHTAATSGMPQSLGVSQRLQRLSARTTHFATDAIVTNTRGDSRMPVGLLEEQQNLLAELRVARDVHHDTGFWSPCVPTVTVRVATRLRG